jgi:hypothetical protein
MEHLHFTLYLTCAFTERKLVVLSEVNYLSASAVAQSQVFSTSTLSIEIHGFSYSYLKGRHGLFILKSDGSSSMNDWDGRIKRCKRLLRQPQIGLLAICRSRKDKAMSMVLIYGNSVLKKAVPNALGVCMYFLSL